MALDESLETQSDRLQDASENDKFVIFTFHTCMSHRCVTFETLSSFDDDSVDSTDHSSVDPGFSRSGVTGLQIPPLVN